MRLRTKRIFTLFSLVAWASGCPALIAQARAAAETNLRAAQSAHDGGQHDESMRQANDALKLLRP